MNTLTIIALILIAVGGVGGILLTVGQFKTATSNKDEIIRRADAKSKLLKNQLDSLQRQNLKLGKDLKKRDSTLENRNNRIVKLNEKLQKKSEYIENYLTGEQGYPYIEFKVFPNTPFRTSMGTIEVNAESQFPIYDINVTVIDYDEFMSKFKPNPKYGKMISKEDFSKALLLSGRIETLHPNFATSWGHKKIPVYKSRYYIKITTRHTRFTQLIVNYEYKSDRWYGMHLFDVENNLIREFYPQDMPKLVKEKILEKIDDMEIELNFHADF